MDSNHRTGRNQAAPSSAAERYRPEDEVVAGSPVTRVGVRLWMQNERQSPERSRDRPGS